MRIKMKIIAKKHPYAEIYSRYHKLSSSEKSEYMKFVFVK